MCSALRYSYFSYKVDKEKMTLTHTTTEILFSLRYGPYTLFLHLFYHFHLEGPKALVSPSQATVLLPANEQLSFE